MSIYDQIVARVPHGQNVRGGDGIPHGGLVLTRPEADALIDMLRNLDGVHVDIGTYFGGSAILAALSKRSGRVVSIDSQDTGHWKDGIVTEQMVRENLTAFGVQGKVELVKANSHPWPLQLWEEITSAFIDGDESDVSDRGGVLSDWRNLRGIVTRFIAFHDCVDKYPGVRRTVLDASYDRRWKMVTSVDSLRIFEHQ